MGDGVSRAGRQNVVSRLLEPKRDVSSKPAGPQPKPESPGPGGWQAKTPLQHLDRVRAADGEVAGVASAASRATSAARANPALMKSDLELQSARDQIQDLRGRAGLARDAKLDAERITWTPVGAKGQLYVDDIGYDDVVQGGTIGDCYLVSSLASLAKSNPQAIRDAITDNHDGTYSVRFFEGTGKTQKPVSITVSDELATSNGKAHYLHDRAGGEGDRPVELWGAVVEKAYAQWKGGYDAIGNGGTAAEAITALTGKKPNVDMPMMLDAKQLKAQLQQAMKQHHPIVAGTWPEGSKGGQQSEALGLVAGHAYTVLDVRDEGGVTMVEVRNPWGKNKPGVQGEDTGVLKFPLKDFVAGFATVTD